MKRLIAVLLVCVLLPGCLALGEDYSPGGIRMEACLSQSAWDWAEENEERMEYLGMLADELQNRIVPGAVQKLLQIPAFRKAAEDGLLSRYITLNLLASEKNQYAAMVHAILLTPEGEKLMTEEEVTGNIALQLRVNVFVSDESTRDSEEKGRELEDVVLHEMTHAFMFDITRNMMLGLDRNGKRSFDEDEDGRPENPYEAPLWLTEGFAVAVQAGYRHSEKQLLELLGEDRSEEEYDRILSDPANMEYELRYGHGLDMTVANLDDPGNAYTLGYVACMYLFSMAAERMGLRPMVLDDENPELVRLQKDALFAGMNNVLERMISGQCLDQIIKEVSEDPEVGESLYESTADFERQCFKGETEPGLGFWQVLMRDFRSRGKEDPDYLESGSILPGYDNAKENYLDSPLPEDPEGETAVYQVVFSESNTPGTVPYAVSTVEPARLALGGNRLTSQSPEDELTDEERDELNGYWIGDQIVLVE